MDAAWVARDRRSARSRAITSGASPGVLGAISLIGFVETPGVSMSNNRKLMP